MISILLYITLIATASAFSTEGKEFILEKLHPNVQMLPNDKQPVNYEGCASYSPYNALECLRERHQEGETAIDETRQAINHAKAEQTIMEGQFESISDDFEKVASEFLNDESIRVGDHEVNTHDLPHYKTLKAREAKLGKHLLTLKEDIDTTLTALLNKEIEQEQKRQKVEDEKARRIIEGITVDPVSKVPTNVETKGEVKVEEKQSTENEWKDTLTAILYTTNTVPTTFIQT